MILWRQSTRLRVKRSGSRDLSEDEDEAVEAPYRPFSVRETGYATGE